MVSKTKVKVQTFTTSPADDQPHFIALEAAANWHESMAWSANQPFLQGSQSLQIDKQTMLLCL